MGAESSAPDGWAPARARTDAAAALKIVIGLFSIFVAVLAILALLNSFFLQPSPGPRTPTDPGPGPEPREQGGSGGRDVTCSDVVQFFLWIFIGTSAFTLAMLGVAVARRHANQGRVVTSVWGIVAIIGLFFTLASAGTWRLIDFLCDGTPPSCTDLTDGFYVAYVLFISLTVGSVAFGIAFAHLRGVSFFKTGVGIIGVILYLPAVVTFVIWWVVRLFCNQRLLLLSPCRFLTETMASLQWTFWIALIGALVSVAVGIVYWRRTGIHAFRSGWAVLAIMLTTLAGLAGTGWLIVEDIHDALPLCNPDRPPPEEPPEPPTCQEILDRMATTFWVVIGMTLAATLAGVVAYRKRPKRIWKSPFMIAAYILLAVALLVGLSWLLLASICDGDGDRAGSGSNGGAGGGRGGGGGSGPGGGGGGVGTGNPVPIPSIQPLPLSILLVVLAVVLGVGLLILLMRRRKAVGGSGPLAPVPAQEDVSPQESAQLMRILAKRTLDSHDAVIAAYRVFLAWSAGQGLSKQLHETPREHARRVGSSFAVPAPALDDFVSAYEVARLSNRPPSIEERRLAVRFSQEILESSSGAELTDSPKGENENVDDDFEEVQE